MSQVHNGLDFDNDFFNCYPASPHGIGHDHSASQFQVYDLPISVDIERGESPQRTKIPSLQELRALDSSESTTPVA
ncbi:hypothetical protein BTUL_0140g00050 [Botrytis tulipae]|uniref:Uncharacterized protein n=1 Tax=Botrytis tulipae TaxID=87230 RepID=A0A4Z1EI79_9HELO|nr:hypothetical protein BTUL_0140g00050 [Botrytis tulipae]